MYREGHFLNNTSWAQSLVKREYKQWGCGFLLSPSSAWNTKQLNLPLYLLFLSCCRSFSYQRKGLRLGTDGAWAPGCRHSWESVPKGGRITPNLPHFHFAVGKRGDQDKEGRRSHLPCARWGWQRWSSFSSCPWWLTLNSPEIQLLHVWVEPKGENDTCRQPHTEHGAGVGPPIASATPGGLQQTTLSKGPGAQPPPELSSCSTERAAQTAHRQDEERSLQNSLTSLQLTH